MNTEEHPSADDPRIGEAARGAVTAHLGGDYDAMVEAVNGAIEAPDGASALIGSLVAYTGNMVKVIASIWECEPSSAWEALLAAEREMGIS